MYKCENSQLDWEGQCFNKTLELESLELNNVIWNDMEIEFRIFAFRKDT